jgi:phosphate transport system substrate-binding protein
MTRANKLLLCGCCLVLSACAPSISDRRASGSTPVAWLNGAISSASSTAYQRWFSQLAAERDLYSELEVTSSGQAMEQLLADRVDFASTDTPPTTQQMKTGLLAFPVTASGVAIAYNHPTCKLSLSLPQVAQILDGIITNYRQLGCSSLPIAVFYRAGRSGTTANLTAALAAASTDWQRKHGVSMQLTLPGATPVSGGLALRDQLMRSRGAFGYLDSAFVAFPLQSVRLQNGTSFYAPDQSQSERALESLQLDSNLLGHVRKPREGYPIVGLNWLVVRRTIQRSKSEALREALQWIYGKRGQEDAELLGYLRIPPAIRQRALQQLSALP